MGSQWTPDRRQAMKLGAGLFAATAFSGFASHTSAETFKLINIEHDSRPLDNAAYEAAYNRFRELNPEIEMEFQVLPWEQARATMLTRAQGGDLPDVGRVAWVADFAAAEMIVPLEDMVDQSSLDRYMPILIEQGSAVGNDGSAHLYGVPWFAGSHSILVNKTLLDEAGLPLVEEWTTDEFAEYAKALTIDGQQWGVALDGSGIGDPVQIFMMSAYAYGGAWVAGDPSSVEPEPLTFNSPETVAGIQWYADLYRNGFAVPSAPSDTYKERDVNFQSGKAAMAWQGPWSLAETQQNFEKAGWEVASLPLPKGPSGANPTSIGGGMVGIYSGAEERGVTEQALAWLNFLTSDEGQITFCKVNGMIPASSTAQKDPYWAENDLYKGYLGTMEGARRMEPIWATSLESLLDDIVPPIIQGMFLDKIGAEDAAAQIQDEVIRGLRQIGVDVPD